MYLSRLLLNHRSRQVQRETADPYNLHRTLMQAFSSHRQQSGVLHRLDTDPRTGVLSLLVQSQTAPDWSSLADKEYLLPADPFSGLENPAVKKVNLTLPNGRILQFRLTANPSKRLSTGKGNKPGPRIAFYKEEEQCAWLRQKGEAHGFRLLDVQASHAQKQTSRQKGITLHTVQYNGRLQITDAAKFITAVQTGIGPAKAFGCGLLSLAPG